MRPSRPAQQLAEMQLGYLAFVLNSRWHSYTLLDGPKRGAVGRALCASAAGHADLALKRERCLFVHYGVDRMAVRVVSRSRGWEQGMRISLGSGGGGGWGAAPGAVSFLLERVVAG